MDFFRVKLQPSFLCRSRPDFRSAEKELRETLDLARGRAEALVLDARAKQQALVMEAEAQAQQQALLAQARADAATRLAQAMQAHPEATEAIRLLLARDWMAMGEAMAQAPGGSVLMVDPQSPASLLTALRGLQQGPKS